MPKSHALYEERSRTGQWRMRREARRYFENIANPRDENDAEERLVGLAAEVDPDVGQEEEFNMRIQHGDDMEVEAGRIRNDSDTDSDPDNPDGQEPNDEDGNATTDSSDGEQAENDEEEDEHEEEDDDDEDDEDRHHAPNARAPLYTGAPVTVQDCMIMVLTLMLSHNLTNSCVSDILRMINLLCPNQALHRVSLYKFKKFFGPSKAPVKKHYYCSHCHNNLENPQAACNICRVPRKASYFVQLPLIPQLRELYKRQSFYNSLQHRFNRIRPVDGALSDIYDSEIYKEQVQNGFLSNPDNISFTWYTDGASVFNCRNYSIWPFSLLVNELPYKMRTSRENVLLAGLWFGPKKPAANNFMRSFVPDLRKLHTGVNISVADLQQQILVRGTVIAGVCDTPAKSAFLNFVGHQGFHGCPVCEIRGETLQRAGETDKHVYRYQEHVTIRTAESVVQQARQALNVPDPVVGVKGPTALRLFNPNFLSSVALDPMHLISGIVKKLLKLHFGAKCSQYPFSLRQVQAVADMELLKMKPPKFVHRRVSSLEHYGRWKAAELKTWFFYFSVPIYKTLLADRYFQHYLKFVVAISYLSSNSVSYDAIDVAKQLLSEFVRDFQELYDLKFCSINIHLLLHLADCVRLIGPTWVYTCYPMEDMNGLMLAALHGKTNIDSQLCNSFWRVLTLHRKVQDVPVGPVKDFINRRKRSIKIQERIANSCYVVGWYTNVGANHPLIRAGLQASNVAPGRLSVYHRLLKNRMIYVCERYTRDKVSNSSFAFFQNGNDCQVGSIICFIKLSRCDCVDDCWCDKEHYAIIRIAHKIDSFSVAEHANSTLSYLHKYEMSMQVKAVPVANLQTVCFYIPVFNSIYIAQPVNLMEVE